MDPQSLAVNILLSLMGAAYVVYGKKQAAPVPLICGILLMLETYVVSGVGWQLITGVGLMAVPFLRR
jgi:hypothetical protein